MKRRTENRCGACQMRMDLCFCDQIHSLQLSTKVLIVMHYSEIYAPTNTARIASLMLKNSEIHFHGKKDQPIETKDMLNFQYKHLFLFPGENSIELNQEFLQKISQPIALVVPDGTWRQAKKIKRRIPTLAHLTSVHLPAGPPSQYFIRRQTIPSHLCTYEAISRCLGLIEGKDIQEEMDKVFKLMMEKTKLSRQGTFYRGSNIDS